MKKSPDVFVLTDEDGRLLSPVRQASVFAKYSRSPDSARDIVRRTDETSSEAFQEKYLVGFGHNSIAELATIPVAFEGVSIIASKAIEKWQRPGVCEKSTREQVFTRDSVLIPDGLDQRFKDMVLPLIDECFELYQRFLEVIPQELSKLEPGLSDKQLKKRAFDAARYLLPAGCRTNLGICAYPRDIAQMIAEFTGSNNEEFKQIGLELQQATTGIGGPLIRHVEPDRWVNEFKPKLFIKEGDGGLDENRVYLESAYPGESSLWKVIDNAYNMSPSDFGRVMLCRPEHHPAPEVFRLIGLQYAIYMDYGAFRDLQRHRRMYQFVEPLTPFYGYEIPPESVLGNTDVGRRLLYSYSELLNKFGPSGWESGPGLMLAQYAVPLAFRVGWHIGLDLQQLFYIVELRTRSAGKHISYWRVAYEMMRLAEEVYPSFMQWCRATKPPVAL